MTFCLVLLVINYTRRIRILENIPTPRDEHQGRHSDILESDRRERDN